MDPTCVMCQYCYDEEQHRGHQVTITISQVDSGGVCDCGDPEAWKEQFHCKYHSLENYSSEPLPKDLHDSIEETVSAALDFTIDVFAQAHTAIQRFKDEEAVLQNEERSVLSKEVYGIEDNVRDKKYTALMWNDNTHSFFDAIHTVRNGTRKSRAFAEMVTKRIDSVGRGVTFVADDLSSMMKMKRHMERGAFVNTVRSSTDIFREEMGYVIIEWLHDISRVPVHGNYLQVRDIVSKCLSEPWNYGLRYLRDPSYSQDSSAEFAKAKTTDKHSALDGVYIPDPMSFVEPNDEQMELDDEGDELDNDVDDDEEEEDDDNEIEAAYENFVDADRRAVAAAAEVQNRLATAAQQLGETTADDGEGAVEAQEGERIGEVEGEEEGEDMAATDTATDAASRLLDMITDNPGMTSLAEIFGYRMNQHQNPRPQKRQKIDKNRPTPEYWTREQAKKSKNNKQVSARVQYLIFFDTRYWKQMRLLMRDLYISTMITNFDYKMKLGIMYADLYTQLAELYILADREPDCSIISSLSTQLFTTPSIASRLVQGDYLGRIMAAIYTFITLGQIAPPQAINPEIPLTSDYKLLRNRKFGQMFHDLDFLLDCNKDKHAVNSNPDRIAQFTDLLMLFQGHQPFQRQLNKHVEYEHDHWVVMFNIMPFIHALGVSAAAGIKGPTDAKECLDIVLPMLNKWIFNRYGRQSNNNNELIAEPDFAQVQLSIKYTDALKENERIEASLVQNKVEESLISLHHPVHAFISHIIERGRFMSSDQLRSALYSCFTTGGSETEGFDYDKALLALFDHPLRVIVLMAQIQSGIWVRNGMSVRSQMIHYRDVTLREYAYRRDLFMVQTMLVALDPATAFMAIRDRWNLNGDMINNPEEEKKKKKEQEEDEDEDDKTDNSIDISKKLYVIEEFLHFLIGILMERCQLVNLPEEELKKKYMKREIIQCLAFNSLPYSEIGRYVPDGLFNSAEFEDVVGEVANYHPPRGLNDYGKYTLKPQFLEQFDTHYIHFSSTRTEEAQESYRKYFQQGDDKKVIVDEPPVEKIESSAFKNLSKFTRTIPFIKMVYDVLNILSNEFSETHHDNIMGNLLQLLHVAALEDVNCDKQQDDEDAHVNTATFGNLMCRELFNRPEDDGDTPCSVVSLLCDLVNNEKVKPEVNAKILRILSLLKEKDGEVVDYLKLYLSETKAEDIPDVESEGDRRKRIGHEKKRQALERMKDMQKQFVENNNDVEQNSDEKEEESNEQEQFLDDECILCQMKNNDNVFGIIGYFMNSNVQRDIPFNDKRWVYEAYSGWADLDQKCTRAELKSMGGLNWQQYQKEQAHESKIGPGFPSDYTNRKPVFVTCGHVMHFNCFTDYLKTSRNRSNQITRNFPDDTLKGEFLCPLCHGMCNVFVPCMWKKNEKDVDSCLQESESFDSFEKEISEMKGEKLQFNLENAHNGIINDGIDCMNNDFKNAVELIDSSVTSTDEEESRTAVSVAGALDLALKLLMTRAGGVVSSSPSPVAAKEESFADLSTLVDILANTISSTEIELRGVPYEDMFGSGLVVGQLKGRKLESIRVFAELCRSVISIVTALKKDKLEYNEDEIRPLVWHMLRKASTALGNEKLPNFYDLKIMNSFEQFVLYAMLAAPAAPLDLVHFIRLFYMRSVVQFICKFVEQVVNGNQWTENELWCEIPAADINEEGVELMCKLVNRIKVAKFGERETILDSLGKDAANAAWSMLVKQITPFLRKCAIFMHVVCGTGYKHEEWEEAFEPEIEKLCTFLKMPSLTELLGDMDEGSLLVDNWISSFVNTRGTIKLEYPGIERLLKLPHRLDECFDLNNHDLGQEVTQLPSEPAICLFCGQTVGLQSIEYSGDPRGECYKHMLRCGQDYGIYLLAKRSSLLLLRNNQGSFTESPYLDLHGESDETLRRGRPQFLQENRYDHFMRSVWLAHDVPSVIARRLETAPDFGGWETL